MFTGIINHLAKIEEIKHHKNSDSLLRISLEEKHKGISTIKSMLIAVIDEAIKKIQTIKGCFDGTRVSSV